MTKKSILNELSVFDNINFEEEAHKYNIGNYFFPISSTGWVHKYIEPFKKDFWAARKAKERGITKEAIIAEWDEIARIATDDIGTPFHRYMECKLDNLHIDIDVNHNEKLIKVIAMGDDFLNISAGKLIPIKSELILGDRELNIAGMVDQLYINTKTGQLEIWDWKTSKKIESESYNKKKMKKPFNKLMDCNYFHYSLQLNLYKYIIEKNTNLKIAKCRIAQFSILNDTYKIYDCIDIQNTIKNNFNILFK